MTASAPAWIGQSAICRRLGISDECWRRWRKAGKVPEPIPNLPGWPKWRVSDIDSFERGLFRAMGRTFFTSHRRSA